MSKIRDRKKSIKYNIEWVPNSDANSCLICDKVNKIKAIAL